MSKQHASDHKALCALLAVSLSTASQSAWQAHRAAARGKTNEAVVRLLPVMDQLDTFTALCRTIIALHRTDNGGTK